mgnify:CR=1 FL=1
MKDSQILSTFQEGAAPVAQARPARALVFDACHVGVILRAVLYVETVMSVGAALTGSVGSVGSVGPPEASSSNTLESMPL